MTKRLTISLPRSLYKQLKAKCKRGTVSRFISAAVEELLVEKRIEEAIRKSKA